MSEHPERLLVDAGLDAMDAGTILLGAEADAGCFDQDALDTGGATKTRGEPPDDDGTFPRRR